MTQIRNAKFYDISEKLNPKFKDEQYLTDEMEENLDEKIEKYVKDNNFQFGDILFVGSSYESRQCYGFRLVFQDGTTGSGEAGYSLPFENLVYEELRQKNVKYEELFKEVRKWDKAEEWWNPEIYDDEASLDFKDAGLW